MLGVDCVKRSLIYSSAFRARRALLADVRVPLVLTSCSNTAILHVDLTSGSRVDTMSTGQELTPILQHAQSADAALRTQAELQLSRYQQEDYSGYIVALVSELANDNKPPETRQIAGLVLKNLLDAADAGIKVLAEALQSSDQAVVVRYADLAKLLRRLACWRSGLV